MIYLLLMLKIALLAPFNLLNVGSALSSEQGVTEGQERDSKRGSIEKSLVPYISPTTHDGVLARQQG